MGCWSPACGISSDSVPAAQYDAVTGEKKVVGTSDCRFS